MTLYDNLEGHQCGKVVVHFDELVVVVSLWIPHEQSILDTALLINYPSSAKILRKDTDDASASPASLYRGKSLPSKILE
jgi:hypothetical protein